MKTQVIIPAAGLGARLKVAVAKPLIELNGKPLIVYSLEVFEQCSCVHSVILAGGKENLIDFKKIISKYKIKKVTKVIEGGVTRRDSVRNGLEILDADTKLVMIHDGARPFITPGLVQACFSSGTKAEALVTAVPVKATIKRVNPLTMTVEATLDRNKLWQIQTPQVFRKELIVKAHRQVQLYDPSDDALLVEKLGVDVKVIIGDEKNIKITTKEDIELAEAILKTPSPNPSRKGRGRKKLMIPSPSVGRVREGG